MAKTKVFLHIKTGNGSCGGTDSDVRAQLVTRSGRTYPKSGRWWVLDNSGDDRERNDVDDYYIVKGSMEQCTKVRLWFKPKGNHPSWDLVWMSQLRWRKHWYGWKADFLYNNWYPRTCLKDRGIYEFESPGPIPLDSTSLFNRDPDAANAIMEHALGTYLNMDSLMRTKSKLIEASPRLETKKKKGRKEVRLIQTY